MRASESKNSECRSQNAEVEAQDPRPKTKARRLTSPILIGVISDTHGLLRPEALGALRGSQHIIHAGDVGGPEILNGLRAVAPVTAVRGNVDKGAWARNLPQTEVLSLRYLLLRAARSGRA